MNRTVRSLACWTQYSEVDEHGKAARSQRADETVCCADVEFTPGNWPKDSQPLRYVDVRIKKRQGFLFASGYEQKFLAVVSNRADISAQQLLRWHWQKAGSIEHIHDVTKNELGAAPPSKYFGANAAWYRFSMLTYNVLSAMKSIALPPTLSAASCAPRPACAQSFRFRRSRPPVPPVDPRLKHYGERSRGLRPRLAASAPFVPPDLGP